MQQISSQSRVFGIFGDPIAHSLSPQMQNCAMRAAGIDAFYLPFHVLPDQLNNAVSSLRALSIQGVNITLPHKQEILPLLDEVDDDARIIGAVNTVVNRNGLLVGYNTDAPGFLRSLEDDLGFDAAGKKVLLYGAGGACRAAVVSLLRAGAESLVLANRNTDKAERLLQDLCTLFPGRELTAFGLNDAGATQALSESDLVVNTTSIGLMGEDLSFCNLEKIKASASVYDMVYSAAETPFVRAAKSRGLAAADGVGMLAGQGEIAFSHWFGQWPEKGLMKKCLLQLRAASNS